ncbi:MAG TPA: response regulator [Tepidisphaeraceae bacterium]|nr:response regulator [Tepidisphaeraceae bacterium]
MSSLLIVEDDSSTSAALGALLRMHGHDVASAQSAVEALSQLRRHQPDLVLLDLGLPRVDGLDLLDALADEPCFSGIPVVVYSGRAEPDTVTAAKQLGACDYIVKSEDWNQTYQRIEACLARTAGGA